MKSILLKALVVILATLLLLDILYINLVLFRAKDNGGQEAFHVVNLKEASGSSKIIDSCYPYSCPELIKEATSSLSPKTATATKSTTAPSSSAAKEFYVTFGSGQTLSDEWEDIPGLSAYIDSTKYGKIKTVTFEASMRIPTANGRVYAQLFNDTDKHPVWFSEISTEGNKSQLVISSPIQLGSGNKIYKVQIKTTLKFLSILDQARMHIITE